MTENNLKNMIENHELDNLMNNREELEKLKSSKTTEQVLEILNKYNYKETNEVFERELLEILQNMELNEEEMKKVSGGRFMNTKNLSMVLGSLMALNSAGFMSAGAVTEEQKNTKKYSVESLLNKVDKKTVMHIGVGAAVVGSFWALKEIVTSRRDNTNFKLNSNQQKIYDNTKELSDMILKYVEDCIEKNGKMPETKLNREHPEHNELLQMIKSIRKDWLNMYDNQNKTLTETRRQQILRNHYTDDEEQEVYTVSLDSGAVEDLFCGLPVGRTKVSWHCLPESPGNCNEGDTAFLSLLWRIEATYREKFKNLRNTVQKDQTTSSTFDI